MEQTMNQQQEQQPKQEAPLRDYNFMFDDNYILAFSGREIGPSMFKDEDGTVLFVNLAKVLYATIEDVEEEQSSEVSIQ